MLSIWSSLKFCRLVKSKPFPKQALVFTCLSTNVLKTLGETAGNKQFFLLPKCFLDSSGELEVIFMKTLIVFVASVDQDQTAQNMHSDLCSSLSTLPRHS